MSVLSDFFFFGELFQLRSPNEKFSLKFQIEKKWSQVKLSNILSRLMPRCWSHQNSRYLSRLRIPFFAHIFQTMFGHLNMQQQLPSVNWIFITYLTYIFCSFFHHFSGIDPPYFSSIQSRLLSIHGKSIRDQSILQLVISHPSHSSSKARISFHFLFTPLPQLSKSLFFGMRSGGIL